MHSEDLGTQEGTHCLRESLPKNCTWKSLSQRWPFHFTTQIRLKKQISFGEITHQPVCNVGQKLRWDFLWQQFLIMEGNGPHKRNGGKFSVGHNFACGHCWELLTLFQRWEETWRSSHALIYSFLDSNALLVSPIVPAKPGGKRWRQRLYPQGARSRAKEATWVFGWWNIPLLPTFLSPHFRQHGWPFKFIVSSPEQKL